MYSRTMSCFASSSSLPSRVLLAPALARESISAHLLVLERPRAASHFLRRASLRALSGSNSSRRSAFSGAAHGSWSSRISC